MNYEINMSRYKEIEQRIKVINDELIKWNERAEHPASPQQLDTYLRHINILTFEYNKLVDELNSLVV